ncbi:Eco57I restriction-modification methylase domain-containing protein [bacterium]|nr:Eco57I restriction-modification methylase domain-containing protein [bacterium]
MNRTELKEKLTLSYDPQNWLDIYRFVFSGVAFYQSPPEIRVGDERVKSFRQVGNIHLNDGTSIALFDIRVNNKTNILRNRVQLNRLVSKYIDHENANGVLAIYSSNSSYYRFTFSAKETEFGKDMELITHQTEPKRYTYVLGPGEACSTAAQRFYQLYEQKSSTGLKDVIEAFSVEKLNKNFFARYKDHYENFVQFITGQRYVKQGGKWKEKIFHEPHEYLKSVFKNDHKQARDYIKKLLSRIVFLHFLQKKGWLGCPYDKTEWTDGDPKFLCNYFKHSPDQNRFHSIDLNALFYEALNEPDRPNDIFERTDSRIPYLNGGLFEPDSESIRNMDFPANYFSLLLDFFSQYNFTIDENDPNDHEVGINPEMLGHIFENLLEDNKDKGAYYTPKPIVQYMCQESLIQYLKTGFDKTGKHLLETEIEALGNFIRYNDKGDEDNPNNFIRHNGEQIEAFLDTVKICDPAIGSGAFPVGLLQLIYLAKLNLDWTLNPAEVKRHIIQNSIYGVDIDNGAVEIARLRFWLSLVVDEEIPQPLPNLDYKIMQGNSLLESFEGIDLKITYEQIKILLVESQELREPERNLFGEILNPQVTIMDLLSTKDKSVAINFIDLLREYFDSHDSDRKRIIKEKLNEFEHQLISDRLNEIKLVKLEEIRVLKRDLEIKEAKVSNSRDNKYNQEEKKIAKAEKSLALLYKSQSTLNYMDPENKPYFLWHLYFMDVFENGGFVIVIGNPPYVEHKKLKGISSELKKFYSTYSGTADLYVYFYEVGINILNEDGTLVFITSNKFIKTSYGKNLRWFFSKLKINELIDFTKVHVFDALVASCILSISKEYSTGNYVKIGLVDDSLLKFTYLSEFINKNKFFLQQKNLSEKIWQLENETILSLKEKIEDGSVTMKEIGTISIYRGVTTGYNPAFIIDEEKRKELIKENQVNKAIIKPLLQGRNIRKWYYVKTTDYLIFTRRGIIIKNYPFIKQHLQNF